MNIRFGLPKKEVKINPLDTIPVLTMELVKGDGYNRRFSLNKRALEVMNINPGESQIIFAFDDTENKAYLANYSSEDSLLVGKNQAFSNKKYYEYISKTKQLDTSVDNYFELTNPKQVGEIEVYELVELLNIETEVNKPINIVDKEIEHLVEETEVPTNGYNEKEEVVADFEPHGDNW